MEKKMTQSSNRRERFAAEVAFVALLLASSPACAQYMSFFGDSTWKYQYTVITRPPEDYLEYPPETPNALGVYCITFSACFSKDYYFNTPLPPDLTPIKRYRDLLCNDHESHPVVWRGSGLLYEDTVHGRLYDRGFLICDMSLSEGDTFVYEGLCANWYEGDFFDAPGPIDTIRITMVVDSIQYLAGRKTIFLSLLDHQDDYFFGTGNHGLLDDYNLSLCFIEGIGPTYGLLEYVCDFHNMYNITHGIHPIMFYYLEPWLGLMQCMYKDDSLVYMAHESLGCDQSCFGFQESISEYSYSYMNLYPNPATQYVVLDLSTGEEMDGMVVITDMLGVQCLQQRAEGANIHINVADLPTGMYFLTYSDGKRTVTRKFLKK